MGVDTSLRVSAAMAEGRFGKKLGVDEIKGLLAAEVTRIMEPVAKPMPLYPKKPQVVLVVGVNGSGNTSAHLPPAPDKYSGSTTPSAASPRPPAVSR